MIYELPYKEYSNLISTVCSLTSLTALGLRSHSRADLGCLQGDLSEAHFPSMLLRLHLRNVNLQVEWLHHLFPAGMTRLTELQIAGCDILGYRSASLEEPPQLHPISSLRSAPTFFELSSKLLCNSPIGIFNIQCQENVICTA